MPETSTSVFPRVYYRKTGSGPSIILLHGFPANGGIWGDVADVLSVYYTVIVPDFPGTGNSDFVTENITIEQLADCVKAILAHENINEVVIAGHSMGGYVALAFAESYAGNVKGLSLVHSTSAADDEEKKQTRLKTIKLIRNGGKNAFIRQMVPNLFSEIFKQSNSLIVERQVEQGLQVRDEALISFYNAMLSRPDRTEVLKTVRFPVQWVIGKDDNLLPYYKVLEKTYENDVNFVSLYENCGHSSLLENIGGVSNDMKKFIDYCYSK